MTSGLPRPLAPACRRARGVGEVRRMVGVTTTTTVRSITCAGTGARAAAFDTGADPVRAAGAGVGASDGITARVDVDVSVGVGVSGL